MADFKKPVGKTQPGDSETRQPDTSGVPVTGFTESPYYDGDAADATVGEAIPANRRVIH
jgi:hypothetical protein